MSTPSSTAVWGLTAQGCTLARSLAAELGAVLFVPPKYAGHAAERTFDRFGQSLGAEFSAFQRHVCVAATGIVVRCIAPLLINKATDPCVVVLDQNGRFAISLVGGHLGGANALAVKVARLTGGQAVITTATDCAGLPALDLLARDLDLVPAPARRWKTIAAALLDNEAVQLHDPDDRLWPSLREQGHAQRFTPVVDAARWREGQPGIWVSWRNDVPGPTARTLCLHPRCLVAGLGCHREVTAEEIVAFVEDVFTRSGLALQSLAVLGTVRARSGENGLHTAAAKLNVDLDFFSIQQLQSVPVPHPSPAAKRLIGAASVCEAAAMILGRTSSLILPKVKGRNLTLAVARRNHAAHFRDKPNQAEQLMEHKRKPCPDNQPSPSENP